MPEWFLNSFTNNQEFHLDVLAFRLGAAFLLGCAVAGIYWLTHLRDKSLTSNFISTLVLLSILIAMVTQVIGDSVARAFSLVGALAIVRFRTVVEDTRDTAFVIFAVVVGMAAGAGQLAVALVGLVIVGCAAMVIRPWRSNAEEMSPYWHLVIRVGVGQATDNVLEGFLRDYLDESHLLATATGRQGAALDLTYKVRLKTATSPITLVGELNRREGVQNVELRRL